VLTTRLTRQRQTKFSGVIFGEPAVGYRLAFKIGPDASIRFRIGHPLKRQSMLNVLCQQIQGIAATPKGHSEWQPALQTLVPYASCPRRAVAAAVS
jgi:hypothetical protein